YVNSNVRVSDYDDLGYFYIWHDMYNILNGEELTYRNEWHDVNELVEQLHDNIIKFKPYRDPYLVYYRGKFLLKRALKFMSNDEIASTLDKILSSKSEEEMNE